MVTQNSRTARRYWETLGMLSSSIVHGVAANSLPEQRLSRSSTRQEETTRAPGVHQTRLTLMALSASSPGKAHTTFPYAHLSPYAPYPLLLL